METAVTPKENSRKATGADKVRNRGTFLLESQNPNILSLYPLDTSGTPHLHVRHPESLQMWPDAPWGAHFPWLVSVNCFIAPPKNGLNLSPPSSYELHDLKVSRLLPLLNLSFLTCMIGIVLVLTWKGYSEDSKRYYGRSTYYAWNKVSAC